jgi:hypothetical protein
MRRRADLSRQLEASQRRLRDAETKLAQVRIEDRDANEPSDKVADSRGPWMYYTMGTMDDTVCCLAVCSLRVQDCIHLSSGTRYKSWRRRSGPCRAKPNESVLLAASTRQGDWPWHGLELKNADILLVCRSSIGITSRCHVFIG